MSFFSANAEGYIPLFDSAVLPLRLSDEDPRNLSDGETTPIESLGNCSIEDMVGDYHLQANVTITRVNLARSTGVFHSGPARKTREEILYEGEVSIHRQPNGEGPKLLLGTYHILTASLPFGDLEEMNLAKQVNQVIYGSQNPTMPQKVTRIHHLLESDMPPKPLPFKR